ncbi:molecular chaperone DnaJ [Actinomadura viridis]|uniref:molecular chaperone DnaJ n=1 Tax=Actinomadura viridis TaxID=58110 RepID=UPI00368A3A97
MTALDDALARLDRARTPADLFGPDRADAHRTYRRLARALHPDANGGRTGPGFARLNAFWRAYNRTGPVTITTRRHEYLLRGKRATGDLADVYDATRTDARAHSGTHSGTGPPGAGAVLKMPRDPADGDLMEREATALRRLAEDGDPRFRAYAPRLIESFRHRDADTGATRRVNAIEPLEGFVSLAEVQRAHPGGLDPRDAAWMWRRLLVALGFAHRAGVVHGAVLPEHVLVHPEDHGLVLIDWCYSVPGRLAPPAGHVPAMVDRYAGWYPPEVPGREPAGAETDIFMATRCMAHLMGGRAPKPMRMFARGCLAAARRHRPADAWRLLEEFDELLERLYGPRRFRPFTMPADRPPE